MSDNPGPSDASLGESLDEQTAELILGGQLDGSQIPASHRELASFVASARPDVDPGSTVDAAELIAERVLATGNPSNVTRLRRTLPKVAAAAMCVALTSVCGVAAAATGVLPVNEEVSGIVERVTGTADEADDSQTPPTTAQDDTDVTIPPEPTTTLPETTTTVPESPAVVHPGAESCEDARRVEGAKGCSAVAKAHAPGQQKAETPDDSADDSVSDDKSSDRGRSEEAKARALEKKSENRGSENR